MKLTEAVIKALREQLLWEEGGAAASLKDEILAISKRCAALPDRDLRSTAEILDYYKHGLPD